MQEEVMPHFHSSKMRHRKKTNSLKTEEVQFPSSKRIIELHMDLYVYAYFWILARNACSLSAFSGKKIKKKETCRD